MDNEYLIRYDFGWFWKKYRMIFNEKIILLSDIKKENFIEIAYKDISHVYRQPLSLDQIDIYCTKDILRDYPTEKVSWFPARPKLTPKVVMFSIHSLKRNEIIESFVKHGVKTSIDPISLKEYWDNYGKIMMD